MLQFDGDNGNYNWRISHCKDCKFSNKNSEVMSDEFNKILSFFVNDVNAEKATALQLINYRDVTQDTLKFI